MLSHRGAPAQEGDVVILYYGHKELVPLTLTRGAVLHCKVGRFAHDAIIGQPLGRYITGLHNSKKETGPAPTLLVLRNSAELWTQAVPHRTQIIYDTDIAVVILQMRLGPGKRVVEAGTGSGSLTHSLARAVAPNGTVFTNDFHKGRCLEARAEFRSHGLPCTLVSSNWRDVCATSEAADIVEGAEADVEAQTEPLLGFGLPPESVDAVFLDVPSPWAAVDNVRRVLRPGGILCTFSPCIEQTQRTAEELRRTPHDFVDIRTVEALTTYFEPVRKRARVAVEGGETKVEARMSLRPELVSKGHSAYLTFARRRLPPIEGIPKEGEDEAGEGEAE